MKNNWLWIIIVVIVVGGAVILLMRSSAPEEETVEGLGEEMFSEEELIPVIEGDANGQFLQEAPEEPVPVTTEETEAATISMTDDGFEPATVEVSVGTTVTFVNNGQGLHWPASDNHPTHEILAGFDAKKGLATGETYSYTFTEIGSWGFHNHLAPQIKGTVVVE
jgi:plastocyanin